MDDSAEALARLVACCSCYRSWFRQLALLRQRLQFFEPRTERGGPFDALFFDDLLHLVHQTHAIGLQPGVTESCHSWMAAQGR